MNNLNHFVEILPRSARRVASRARRADRTPALLGLKRDANAIMDRLRVVNACVGAVGATAALSLAHLQAGELRVLDCGRYGSTAPATQPVTASAVGRAKAGVIARRCKEISPATRVLVFDGPLQDLPLAEMAGADVAIVAGDNLSVLYEAAQRCQRLRLPLIRIAVHGETLTVQCHAYSNADPNGPCPVCQFCDEEFRMLEEERVLSCGGFRDTKNQFVGRALQPTRSLRPLCALAGEMAALQAVRLALRLGPPVADTMLEICAYTWRSHVTPLRRNPKCPCAHESYKVARAPRALSDCTTAELLRTAGLAGRTAAKLSLAVEGFNWVERALCGCAESRAVNRFVRARQAAVARCARCRKPVSAQPFYSHDTVSFPLLEPYRTRSLRDLGASGCRGVLVRHEAETVLLTNPDTKARA